MPSSLLLVALALTPLLPAMAAVLLAVSNRPTLRAAAVWIGAGAAMAVVTIVGVVLEPAVARDGLVLGDGSRFAVGVSADRVGAVIGAVTLLVGLVVAAAATRMFEGDPRARRFGVLAGALVGGVAFVALGATLLTVAIGWLASGAAVLALLRTAGRQGTDAVRRTAATFAIGDAALVLAVVVTLATVGAVDLRDGAVALEGRDIGGFAAGDVLAVLLVVAGLCRAALVPMTRWLPATVAAPTPVSALLHAGVVNGVGVLVLRTAPVTTASTVAMTVLMLTGALTAAAATAVMLVRTDAKGALAWSTAGQMGFMAVQLAVGALASALFHLVGHAMYKAALFLHVGGTVDARVADRHRAAPRRPLARLPRAAVALGVTGVATAAAVALMAPALSAAESILVVGFGWWSASRLVDGWLAATERRPVTLAIGLALGVALPAAYVGAMAAFKAFVGDALAVDAGGAVPAAVLAAVLAGALAGGLTIRMLPGAPGRAVRRRAYAFAVGLGASPVPRRAVVATMPARAPQPGRDRERDAEREAVPGLVPA